MNAPLHGARWTLLGLVGVLLGASACRTPPPERPADVREDLDYVKAHTAWRIRASMEDANATAVALVLVDASEEGSGIVWANGFGRGHLAGSVNADSVFRVGSISKLASALVTKLAAREGVLDIDAPIVAALPSFTIQSRFPDARAPTLRDLMTHHAGVPSDLLRGMYGTKRGDYTNVVDALRDEHLSTAPGTLFTYSDVGYALLGAAVEVAGKESFLHRAERTLFVPLGMAHTSFDRESDVATQVLPGWMAGAELAETGPTTTPANGLFTSASDLGRLMVAMMRAPAGNQALAADDVADVLKVQNASVALDVGFTTGLGINLAPPLVEGGGPIALHSGQTIAFVAELMMLPEEKLGVAVLTNTPDGILLPQTVAREALSLFLESRTGKRVPPQPPIVESASFTEAELRACAGAYATDYGLITLDVDGAKLRGRAFEEVLELRPTAAKRFDPWILGFGVVPVKPDILKHVELSFEDVAGERAMVTTRFGVRSLRGVRIQPTPILPSWAARVGTYRNTDPGDDQITITSAQLVIEDELLLFKIKLSRYPRPLTVALTTLDDDEAITQGLGRSMGETVRVDEKGRLIVVGYPLERVLE